MADTLDNCYDEIFKIFNVKNVTIDKNNIKDVILYVKQLDI